MVVDASSERRADESFDRIDIQISGDRKRVSARTVIDSRRSGWSFFWQSWGDTGVKIYYEVTMPRSADLDLSHRYGDVSLADLDGRVAATVKYGNLEMGHASGDLKLDLAYGHGAVAKANRAVLSLAYYKLRMNDLNTLDVQSKYSQLAVESANRIKSTSAYDAYQLGDVGHFSNTGKYDNVKIDQAEVIEFISRYSKLQLGHLLQRLSAEMSYGGVEVQQVQAGFDRLQLQTRYTGIELGVAGLGYELDFEGRYTDYRSPSDLTVARDVRENNRIQIRGHAGSGRDGGSIHVRAEYGSLRLK